MIFINIHCHKITQAINTFSIVSLNSSDENIFSSIENIFYSIGTHPWYIDEENPFNGIDEVLKHATNSNFLAVGECGLDKTIEVPIQVQEQVFLKHIEIANSVGKPLIIHCVKAWQELVAIKKKSASTVPWIIHGFRGKFSLAKQLINAGCYLSFGQHIFITGVEKTFTKVPVDRIFLETDDSAYTIDAITAHAAKLKSLPDDALVSQLHANFAACFNISADECIRMATTN